MGLAVFVIITVVIVVFLFAQRLNARRLLREQREAPPEVRAAPTEPSTPELPSAAATDDIAARIEDEAQRMGIRVSPEDVQQIARQIRDAQGSDPGDAPVAPSPTIPGAAAHAVIVSVPGATVPVTLDVEAPGGSTRRITVQLSIPQDRWSALAAGTRLPVTVDPDDPTTVSIDWDGVERR